MTEQQVKGGMERIAVIDFETTGLSPGVGCRATEIAVVLVENGRVMDRFQSLMNAGVRIPPEIERLTGISNAMLKAAPPADRVMREAADFVGDTPLVAHNAAFDRKFWDFELGQFGRTRQQGFACTLLLARRLLSGAPNHQLGTLTRWAGLPATGQAHRALADAEMAANLMDHLMQVLRVQHGVNKVSHQLLCSLQKVAAKQVPEYLRRVAAC